jgi:hypothetical protein
VTSIPSVAITFVICPLNSHKFTGIVRTTATTAAMMFFKILIASLLGPGQPLPSMLPFAHHQRGRLMTIRPCRVDEIAPPFIYLGAGRAEKVWGLGYVNGYSRALAYGQSQEAAVSKVQALALRVLQTAWSTAKLALSF